MTSPSQLSASGLTFRPMPYRPMTFRDRLSALCRRWITPADAASVASRQGLN